MKPPLKRQFQILCKRGRAIVHTIEVEARDIGEALSLTKQERDLLSIRRCEIRDLTNAKSKERHGGAHTFSTDWRSRHS